MTKAQSENKVLSVCISRIRWANARAIAKELAERLGKSTKGYSILATRLGVPSGYMSAILCDNPTKAIGHNTAKRIQIAGGKELEWLDVDRDGQSDVTREKEVTSLLFPLIGWGDVKVEVGDIEISQNSKISYPCAAICSEKSFVLTVPCSLMEPVFFEGDLIFVDPDVKPTSGRYIVAQQGATGKIVFRQYIELNDKRYLKTTNSDYPADLKFTLMTDICRVIGTVVSVSRNV